MRDGLKYIIYETENRFTEDFLVFPMFQKHDDIWRKFANEYDRVISAGFVKIVDGKLYCHGKSVGLGVSSRQETDSKLLNRVLAI